MLIPLELQAVIPNLAVPVQPLLLEGSPEFSMFRDLRRKYHWVLRVHIYEDPTDLFSSFEEKVIAPAAAKAIELRDDRTVGTTKPAMRSHGYGPLVGCVCFDKRFKPCEGDENLAR